MTARERIAVGAARAARRFLPVWPKRYDRVAPPVVPAGWVTGAPDFVGVGGMKCGTTWWYSLLRRHPEVTIAEGVKKEIHFFDEFFDRELTATDIRRYHSLFPKPVGHLTGEWSTSYANAPWVAPLLSQAAPDARLLFLVRDPIERYRSGLTHHLDRGAPHHEVVASHAIDRGRFGAQLANLVRYVDRQQILVLQYERCRDDPAREYARTCEFLGIDSTFVPDDLDRVRYGTRSEKVAIPDHLIDVLRGVYAADVELLTVLAPDVDVSRWLAAPR